MSKTELCRKHHKTFTAGGMCPVCWEKSADGSRQVDLVVIPQDVLDLVRFLAETWTEIDAFVYEHCTGEQLAKYPVVQGTRNQMDLRKIGKQKYDSKKIRSAVDWLLAG